MDTFQLKIVTPEYELYNKKCHQVDLPGNDGRFGVLANHMNLISTLKPGIIEIIEQKNEHSLKFIIADGFVNVGANQCTVLIEKGIELSKININEFNSYLAESEIQLESAKSQVERKILKNEIDYFKLALANAYV